MFDRNLFFDNEGGNGFSLLLPRACNIRKTNEIFCFFVFQSQTKIFQAKFTRKAQLQRPNTGYDNVCMAIISHETNSLLFVSIFHRSESFFGLKLFSQKTHLAIIRMKNFQLRVSLGTFFLSFRYKRKKKFSYFLMHHNESISGE